MEIPCNVGRMQIGYEVVLILGTATVVKTSGTIHPMKTQVVIESITDNINQPKYYGPGSGNSNCLLQFWYP